MNSPSVLFANELISIVSPDRIDQLKSMALNSPLKRARLCMHLSHDDAVQEMVIVLHRDSYIRPHRHQNKTESFHMIEGSILVVFFEDSGQIKQTLPLHADRSSPFLYRLSASFWHSVVTLSEFAIFHEVSTGPFSSSEYPSWEPENQPDAIHSFKEKILSCANLKQAFP